MWERRLHTLAPLTKITSNKVTFKWTKMEQYSFYEIKRIFSRNNLLTYPDFNEELKINTNARKFQLGAVINQKDKPISLYSRKLTDSQKIFILTENELVNIVETLKEFRTVLFVQILRFYTDNKNVICKCFNTDRVLIRRIIIEEYAP